MEKYNIKFWVALFAAGFFFYKWNEALFCQSLSLPLMVRGYEAASGQQVPAPTREIARAIEAKYYQGTDGGAIFGLAPAKKACCQSCAHDGGECGG